ncbi:MAG TPA: SsrA-binding protein SmpB [Patescibacteria group bacterium]|jgi:SsrA-binding protein|nr:SsrA-binding protein SmpB [Patescibacteria group bacterium]
MKSLAFNKRAKFDYDIKETFDAGLVLDGGEVKAVKEGNTSLAGSYVKVSANSATLTGAHIGPYKYAKKDDYDPTHDRKLLLKKSELAQMIGKEKGLTIVPMEIFVTNRGLVKVRIGIGRGRKKEDKREYIKNRDSAKEMRSSTDR